MAYGALNLQIVDGAGNVQAEASVEIRRESDNGLATLYSDRDGQNPIMNPFVADSEGYALVFMEGGAYKVTASKDGFSRTWRYQPVGLLSEKDYVDFSETETEIVEPYIILATGQSNIARHGSHAWTPPTNLHLWGWDGQAGGDDDEDVGTAFAPMDDETMGYAYSYAAELAKDHPFRQVYLVNIGIGGAPIASWMTGDPDPDMYAACKNNVEAALAVLGRSAINEFVWWQGEADATSSTYAVDFETVIARFRAETWFPADTPILVTGISEIYSTNQTRFADTLRSVAGFEPGLRSYADIAKLPASIWEVDNIHLTAAGNEIAGRYAYKTTRQSSAAAALSKWKIVTKGAATARANTATVADDPHLKFPVKANRTIQCRFNMNVVLTSTNPDFKFSVSGPAAFASQARWTYIVGSDAGAPKSGWSATYPSGVVIEHNAGAASNIFLTLELTITDPSEDGEVVFQWAQGTSHEDIVGVSAGSYVEYFDIGFTHA